MLPLAELLPLLARPVIDAIAARPGQSETERAAWVDSATRRIIAFEPRDGMEVMLACQAVMVQFLMLDAFRDAANAATPEQARRRRGQAAILGRAHSTILKEVRTHRASVARISKGADPAAPAIHAPIAQSPEVQPPSAQSPTSQPDASAPRPCPQMTPAAILAQPPLAPSPLAPSPLAQSALAKSPALSRPHTPIPPHPGRQQAGPVVLPGLPVPGGRPGADPNLLASALQAARASR